MPSTDAEGAAPPRSDLRSRSSGKPPEVLHRCAARVFDEVRQDIVALSACHGRAGVVVRLRALARELGRSAVVDDLVKSSACGAAADDLAWGRTPLDNWLAGFTASQPSLTPRFGAGEAGDAGEPARRLAGEIAERDAPVLEADAERARRLKAAALLQFAGSHHVALPASDATRRVMWESGRELLAEAERLRVRSVASPTRVGRPAPGAVSRLLAWVRSRFTRADHRDGVL